VDAYFSGPCDPIRVDMGAFENADCNGNQQRDETELDGNDLDNNLILDSCQDCNENGQRDDLDIDGCHPCNAACQDCNDNGRPDKCDIRDGCEADDNQNGIPDGCENPGTNLRQFVAPIASNGRGLAFDGTDLYYTLNSDAHRDIYQVTTHGELTGAETITPICPSGGSPVEGRKIGALAFDGTGATPTLWAATYDALDPVIFRVDIATGEVLETIDSLPLNPNDPTDFPHGIDGLAFDPSDNSLFYSADLAIEVFNIAASGGPGCEAIAAEQDPSRGFFFPEADMAGHAFDGTFLYTGQGTEHFGDPNSNPDEQILRTLPDSPEVLLSFRPLTATGGQFRLEDLAFDSVTFAPKCAVWANEATEANNRIAAFEVPCPCQDYCRCDCAVPPDGTVNVVDFLATLAQWGGPGSCDCAEPPDGTVDVIDFLAMLATWGDCPGR
jgi:hypothetical protein